MLLKGTYTDNPEDITILFDCVKIIKAFQIKHNLCFIQMSYITKYSDTYVNFVSMKTKLMQELEVCIQNYSMGFHRLASILGISLYTRHNDNEYIISKVIDYYLQNQFSYYTFKQWKAIYDTANT